MRRITLMQYLIEQERQKDWINADLRLLIEVVSRACKAISIAIGKGELAGMLGGAGSGASDGRSRILDIRPTALHQRVAVILGSKNEAESITGYHAA